MSSSIKATNLLYGMALAASVVLAAVTVVVIALVERLRVGTIGAF